MINIILKLSSLIFIVYSTIIFILSLDTPQRGLMFLHWIRFPFNPKYDTPEFYGFGHNLVRNIKIQTSDNVTIGAWHFLPKEYYDENNLRFKESIIDDDYDLALNDEKYDTIVYFHGNALNRVAPWRIDLYKQLSSRSPRANIISIDYRGFGDSESTPSEWGLQLDAKSTLSWLNKRGVSNNRISLIGHSLGTGVATYLASEMSLANAPPKSVILKAGYSSMTTLIFEYNIVPYVPVLSPIKNFPALEGWLLSKLNHKFDSLSKISDVKCPILIIYGQGDLQIPITNSKRLFEKVASTSDISSFTLPNEAHIIESKTSKYNQKIMLVELLYGDHNNVGYFDYTYEVINQINN